MAATDSIAIAALGLADAAGALALSAEAGWNQTVEDWRFMLARGAGFGVREGGAWVGSALVLPIDARTSWISMVLVAAARRRRGLGTALFARCLETVAASGAVAALDATEFGRPVYAKLGFAEVWEFARRRLARPPEAAPPPGVTLRPATAADLPGLATLDRAASGVAREALLAHLLARAPRLAWLAERGGAPAGFALGRDGRVEPQIGPVVADDEGVARALLARASAAAAAPAILDTPASHAALGAWLDAGGATPARRFSRMARGSAPHLAGTRSLFAIAGPELG